VDATIIDPPIHGAERSEPAGLFTLRLARHGGRDKVSAPLTLPVVARVSQQAGVA
jgi:hypothetical protein